MRYSLRRQVTYILDSFTFVQSGVTLSIDAGVIIRGQPYQVIDEVEYNPGSLIVSRGGQICADGTAELPIIFTTAANTSRERWTSGAFLDADPKNNPLPPFSGTGVNAVDNANLWGAVTILGYAPINTNESVTGVAGEDYIEGFGPDFEDERITYGGRNPTHSSGTLRYVSIRHTGQTFSPNQEQQGLTLGGVGSGTILQYIDVYCTGDDGIEVFGGAAEIDHVMISYADDDGLDLDQGFVGTVQFVYVLGSQFAPNGLASGLQTEWLGEWDGDDDIPADGNNVSETGQPFQHPALYNLTFMGPDQSGVDGVLEGGMVRARQSFGGDVRNSLFINGRSASSVNFRIDSTGTTNATAYDYPSVVPQAQAEAGTLTFAGTMWYLVDSDTVAGIGADDWARAILNNGSYGAVTVEGSILNQVGNNPFVGGTDQSTTDGLNPRPQFLAVVDDVAYDACGLPCSIVPVTYIGAFDPNEEVLWTTGWTAMNLRNILADGDEE